MVPPCASVKSVFALPTRLLKPPPIVPKSSETVFGYLRPGRRLWTVSPPPLMVAPSTPSQVLLASEPANIFGASKRLKGPVEREADSAWSTRRFPAMSRSGSESSVPILVSGLPELPPRRQMLDEAIPPTVTAFTLLSEAPLPVKLLALLLKVTPLV